NQIIVTRTDEEKTKEIFSKKAGRVFYTEEQETKAHYSFFSKRSIESMSTVVERQRDLIEAGDFAVLPGGSLVFFDEGNISTGYILQVNPGQKTDAPSFQYRDRKDIIDFMKPIL
ncbi:MAG: hypothetical protein LBU09_01490, partial [Endomicrobium sp.]|nr:hypothetical protein [Endomicrobium sp.]